MYACNHGLATCSMASMRGMHTRQGTCACSSANMHTYPVARTASGVLWALTLHVDAAPPARRARRACFYPAASAYLPCRAKKHERRARRRARTVHPAGQCAARDTRTVHAHDQHRSTRDAHGRGHVACVRSSLFSCGRRLTNGFYVNSIQTLPTASGKAAIDRRWDNTHGRLQEHSLRRQCGQLGLSGIPRQSPSQVSWGWIPLTLRQVFASC